MNPLIAAAVFFIIWWMTLFMVLPWGIRRDEEIEEGNDPGAPKKSSIAVKLIINTALAFVIWIGILAVNHFGLISFDQIG